MDSNEKEIKLLYDDPGQLLTSYQDLISIIVHRYRRLGYVSLRDTQDLVQEINRKLLERLPRIQKQYNGKSRLRTYFSVIVRNICLEEIRKKPILEEPREHNYNKHENFEMPVDGFLIRQEYERFEKALKLMFKDRMRFSLMLRYILELEVPGNYLLDLYPESGETDLDFVMAKIHEGKTANKKRKLEILSEVLGKLENQNTSADSLRKWFAVREEEFLRLMNGDPPRSAYTMETIQILIEEYENSKNDD